MSGTLSSGSVTESLHLIQDLLIAQLRLTGTCGYLSDGFCYTNNNHTFQTTAVRNATSISSGRQAAAAMELALKSALHKSKVKNSVLCLFSNQSLCTAVFVMYLPFAWAKGVCFCASGTLLYWYTTSVLKIYLYLLVKIGVTPLISIQIFSACYSTTSVLLIFLFLNHPNFFSLYRLI